MEKQYIDMMKQYAYDNDVPIIEDEGLEILETLIKKHDVKTVLEIGTAISYSAQMMTSFNACHVTTIERDEQMFKMAKYFVDLTNNKNVELNLADALLLEPEFMHSFDLIYIDAAKAQYRNFYEKYKPFLSENGIIVFDNLSFHGYAEMDLADIKSKNLRQLMRKLKDFNEFIKNQDEFDFEFIVEGDGIGVCTRRKI